MNNIVSFKGSKEISIVPARIRKGRIFRGLSITELAEKLDISKQALSRMEIGTLSVNSAMLVKISDSLDFPLDFFSKGIKQQVSNNSAIFFRTNSISKKLKEKYSYKMDLYNEDLISYFRKYFNLPKLNLPENIYDVESYTDEQIDDIAMKVRNHWGLGLSPISNLMDIIQKNGIIIFNFALEDTLKNTDGFSQWNNGNPTIAINKDNNYFRTRFSLAHELGHILLHSDVEEFDKEELSKIESEANRFASTFLMPEETFKKDIYYVGLNELLPIKKKWGVSVASIIHRCRSLGYVSEERYVSLQKHIQVKKWKKEEPYDASTKKEIPLLFRQCIDILLNEKILTKNEILNELSYPCHLITEAFSLDEDFFDEKIVDKNYLKVLK